MRFETRNQFLQLSLRTIALVLTVLALSASTCAQNAEGNWEGTLKAGTVEFRLVLHVTKDGNGGFKATLDSLDQNVSGIPIDSFSVSGADVKFALASIQASYAGKLKADGSGITGNWSQPGADGTLDFVRAVPKAPSPPRVSKPSNIDGRWEGVIDAGHTTLRVALVITSYEDGMTAKFDSLDQGLNGVPVAIIAREGARLTFTMKQFGATYAGTLDADLKTIAGKWSQGGGEAQLNFKRAADAEKKP